LFSKVREYYYDLENWIDSFYRCIQNLRNGSETLPSFIILLHFNRFLATLSAA